MAILVIAPTVPMRDRYSDKCEVALHVPVEKQYSILHDNGPWNGTFSG